MYAKFCPTSKSIGIKTMKHNVLSFLREDQGATAVEYSLLIGLIALAIFMAVAFLGSSTRGLFSQTAENFANF